MTQFSSHDSRFCYSTLKCRATERYDGVNFRVLRKAQREGYCAENLDVLILSAKYGLIESDYAIEDYERTSANSAITGEYSFGFLHLKRENYREIFINLGKTYLITIELSDGIRRAGQNVLYATGGIGSRVPQMKQWLRGLN